MARTRLAAAAAAATLVLCATSAASAATVSPDAKPAQSAPAPTGSTASCTYTKAVPADKFQGIPVFDAAQAAKPYHATLHTSQGAVTFQALTAAAPCTTFSFRFLADHHYFNHTHCHRLTTQGIFVLQCGDPTGTGSGGPGYSFNDENLTGATYPAGTVAMANAGPNTNGSQFFFVWKDTKLPPAYTPFGRVTGGLDVLQKIAAGGEDDQNAAGDGFPNLPVDIKSVKISNH
ncbi:peptidylprolyl isomerase [Kitasatospora kifunensis]|uniref:Peptidyl-prolyl cis-trans isomerase n=1 Tax=Kitasatospora kifunensis TaxID=58351 RepID=A0A7W7R2K1_KITKI|nr:peptidylprolyl isomerase [Kitasatospora kifunensis]MBB4924049.1 peptidyl-prolyl cis-trans isomerase B (cyclophilin B) [Kitasatospora kifunensis]